MKFVRVIKSDYRKTIDELNDNERKQVDEYIKERKATYESTYQLLVNLAQTMAAYINNYSKDANEFRDYSEKMNKSTSELFKILTDLKNRGN